MASTTTTYLLFTKLQAPLILVAPVVTQERSSTSQIDRIRISRGRTRTIPMTVDLISQDFQTDQSARASKKPRTHTAANPLLQAAARAPAPELGGHSLGLPSGFDMLNTSFYARNEFKGHDLGEKYNSLEHPFEVSDDDYEDNGHNGDAEDGGAKNDEDSARKNNAQESV
ncbi:hypothetical protein P171DRAFT_478433 [Karstenula rhodostoma CBS 690.94]|uniref:Uncharacterized protein n=1 Tax=Karstenula rhodostoma CBS 690.94 TaxID=1392251 RepID=A0A9P4PYW3_9PLEO|nr:hypothetical protein P171DRAFT_478433 [Karstenula rhodostoma CBS 690.94]